MTRRTASNKRKSSSVRKAQYQKRANQNKSPDFKILYIVTILTIWGSIMVYSGSVIAAARQGNAPYHYFIRQVLFIIIGTMLGYIAYKLNYKHIAQLAIPGLGVVMFLLLLVLIINFEQDIKRWIPLGPFTFQPSELAKVVFFVYLSSWLAKKRKKATGNNTKDKFISHIVQELFPFLLLLGAVSIPILIEPDLDTTIIIATTSFIVYFISGNNYVHLISSTMLAGIFTIVGGFFTTLKGYRIERIVNWFGFWQEGVIQNPFGSGYQLRQILVAIASGGFWGLGFGQSRQKFHYLGETAFTDTIFAIFAEEYGLIGSVLLILMYVYFLMRGYKIARNAPDKYSFLLAIAITTWLSLQSLMHIASNVAMIPINGNTLPFFSYGGSSTIINLIAIGILLNISKHAKNLD